MRKDVAEHLAHLVEDATPPLPDDVDALGAEAFVREMPSLGQMDDLDEAPTEPGAPAHGDEAAGSAVLAGLLLFLLQLGLVCHG